MWTVIYFNMGRPTKGICLFLLFVGITTSLKAVSVGEALYVITNGNVTINPQFKGHLTEILWKHDGHKAVEWTSTGTCRPFREFEGRTELNTMTGQITINNLSHLHSGTYEAEGEVDGQLKTFKLNIEVLDPVQPIISCGINNSIATLSCRAQGPRVEYQWFGPDQAKATWSQEERGPSFSSDSSGSANYTCVARNPVSERTQSFYAKDCTPLERSRETFLNVTVVAVSLCVVSLVALLIGVFIYIRKGKRRNGQKDQVAVSQKLLPETVTSDVKQNLQSSPGKQAPPKPTRRHDSIRGSGSKIVMVRQADHDFPATRQSSEDEEEEKESSIEEGDLDHKVGEDGERREISIEEGDLDHEVGEDGERREISIEEEDLDHEVGEDEREKREISIEEGDLDQEVGEDGERREMLNEVGGLDNMERGMNREGGGQVYRGDEENGKGVHEEGNKEKRDEEEVRTQDTVEFEIEREEKVESCRGGTESEDKGEFPELMPDELHVEASTHCGTGKTTNPSENSSQKQSCLKSHSKPPVPPKPAVRLHLARPT